MSRYTSATDADREAMLEAIGVGSIDELFDDIPEDAAAGSTPGAARRAARDGGLRPARASWLRGTPHAESETELPRRRDVRPATCRRSWTRSSARSEFLTPYTPYQPEISQGGLQAMFEFQTAMSELTGPAGLERGALRGTLGRRLRGLPRDRRDQAAASWSPRGACTPTAASRSSPTATGYGTELVEVPLADGVTDAAALAEAIDDETAAVFLQQPNFLGAVEDIEALGGRGEGEWRAGGRRLRPGGALDAEAAGRVRRRHRGRRGPAARQPARLRRPLVRVLLRDRGAPPPHAGPDRRGDHRRRRPPRLRADAADARAAHPPREGDPQHLHRAGAERAGRDGPPRLARQARLRRARGAAGAPHRVRARAADRARGRRAAARGPRRRASSRCDSTRRSRRSSSAAPPRASAAGYPLGRDYPEYEDGLLVALSERRDRADIDRLAEVLGRAVAELRGAKVTEGVAS